MGPKLTYRYFIELSYRGTNYHGWQVQENAASVQGVLNSALSTLLKEEVCTLGAGRTDTGVHARYYVAHFDCRVDQLGEKHDSLYSLNRILPRDISVSRVIPVSPEAHARFDALSRTYEYLICRNKDPFWLGLAWLYSQHLDVEQMKLATQQLFSFTDFTSFSKVGSDNKTYDCNIISAYWEEQDNLLVFSIRANRFLRNMVRAIVGTLIDVGRKKITPDHFARIIEAKDRSLAGTSAPAEGLYLTGIEYPNTIFPSNVKNTRWNSPCLRT
jgi:tRNA pseudouridine38-40 synthase